MLDTKTTAAGTGVFTRDQVEILAARKDEPAWLRDSRLAAQGVFAALPMPDRRMEDWRYTNIGAVLRLDALAFADEQAPVASLQELPEGLRAAIEDGGERSATLAQVDASVVLRDLPAELAAQGVVLSSLEAAARGEHGELVRKHLGSAVTPDDGKFAALSGAFWSGGAFLYVPRDVRVELPIRLFRWLGAGGVAALGRTLVVVETGAQVAVVDEVGSGDVGARALALGAAEIFAGEGAQVTYVSIQRWGKGVVHLTTDRLVAERDARITTVYATLGADLARADVRCRLRAPGAHVDMLGLYIAQEGQHFDQCFR